MCDLFGLSSNQEDRATLSLPIFGKETGHNPDGWGLVYYKEGKVNLIKNPEKAYSSTQFYEEIKNAKSNIIIAHTRVSTGTDKCKENCHPFKQIYLGREWTFAHNGWISNMKLHERSLGKTDSESIFNYLLDKIQIYRNNDDLKGIYPGIRSGIKSLFEDYGKNIKLNFLMSDGILLYVFSHYPGKPIYYLRREKSYGSAFLASTHKLSSEQWLELPQDRLFVLNNGEMLIKSEEIIKE